MIIPARDMLEFHSPYLARYKHSFSPEKTCGNLSPFLLLRSGESTVTTGLSPRRYAIFTVYPSLDGLGRSWPTHVSSMCLLNVMLASGNTRFSPADCTASGNAFCPFRRYDFLFPIPSVRFHCGPGSPQETGLRGHPQLAILLPLIHSASIFLESTPNNLHSQYRR